MGGVAGVVILAALAWFLLRKRRKSHRAEFDDMMVSPRPNLADISLTPIVRRITARSTSQTTMSHPTSPLVSRPLPNPLK